MSKKTLRRGAILAMVLVLLFSHTVGASASTGAPSSIASNYVELYTALDRARDGDVIGIRGTIIVPSPDRLQYANVTVKRMEAGARIIFRNEYGYEGTATVKNLCFDGNMGDLGGTSPFIIVEDMAVSFSACEFENCYYEGGSGGAVSVGSSGEAYFSSCRFDNNCADYGGSLYNAGTVTLEGCVMVDSWAEENGGAIYNGGTLTIKDTEIRGGTARIGGGLFSWRSAEIYNSLIWNNTASIHGSDIAYEGSYTNHTTEEQFNSWLAYYNLYYAGWENELNTSVGGAGDYVKFLTTDTDPNAPTTPTDPDEGEDGGETGGDPVDPSQPEDGGETGGNTGDEGGNTGGDSEDNTDPSTGGEETGGENTPDEGEDNTQPTDPPSDVGRILRTFKIKKNVEVTDNGKIII